MEECIFQVTDCVNYCRHSNTQLTIIRICRYSVELTN